MKIPSWDSTLGDEKIETKGAKLTDYLGGLRYRYPWVPFSFTLDDNLGETSSPSVSYQKAKTCTIKNNRTGNELIKVQLNTSDELNELVPDCQNYIIDIDGDIYI